MTSSIKLKAPAKINLRLEVLGELPIGYHKLRMFNITIDLFDELAVSFQGEKISVEADNPAIPSGPANLAYRAAAYFLEKYSVKTGVKIRIKKNIPMGGGLAGGSTDAAAVLKALADQFGIKRSKLDLEEIAYKVGADVPYLIFDGPAWVHGIGEKIEPLKDFPEPFYLLVNPGFSVSTGEVFGELGRVSNLTIDPKAVILSRLRRDGFAGFCVNHLEKVVFARHHGLKAIKNELVRLGALASLMSGSGSTLVGIFLDKAGAEQAAKTFSKKPGFWVRVVRQYKSRGARD